jgi:hypothetical protein
MWRFESLMLLYVLAGLAVWTWVIRNYSPRARQRARGARNLRRRQRVIEAGGASSIVIIACLAGAVGWVDVRGVALVLGVLVGGAHVLVVLAFSEHLGGAVRSSAEPQSTYGLAIKDDVA